MIRKNGAGQAQDPGGVGFDQQPVPDRHVARRDVGGQHERHGPLPGQHGQPVALDLGDSGRGQSFGLFRSKLGQEMRGPAQVPKARAGGGHRPWVRARVMVAHHSADAWGRAIGGER